MNKKSNFREGKEIKTHLPQCRHDRTEPRRHICILLYRAISFGFLIREHRNSMPRFSSPEISVLVWDDVREIWELKSPFETEPWQIWFYKNLEAEDEISDVDFVTLGVLERNRTLSYSSFYVDPLILFCSKSSISDTSFLYKISYSYTIITMDVKTCYRVAKFYSLLCGVPPGIIRDIMQSCGLIEITYGFTRTEKSVSKKKINVVPAKPRTFSTEINHIIFFYCNLRCIHEFFMEKIIFVFLR